MKKLFLFVLLLGLVQISNVRGGICNLIEMQNHSRLEISWTAPGDDASSGVATRYEIGYSYSLVTLSNWSQGELAPDPPELDSAGYEQCYEFIDHPFGVMRYYALRAADEVPKIGHQ